MTNEERRDKGEKKKESHIFTKVRIAYKRKAKRSLLVDEVNRVGLPPKGKKD